MQPERRLDRSADSLEARLRALPPPGVPADLEARLLAAIPAAMPTPQRRWAVWIGVAGALAAAVLLAILAWPGRGGKDPLPSPPNPESAHQVARGMPDETAASLAARRDLDEAELPPFIWPLPETSPMRVSMSIPPGLLD